MRRAVRITRHAISPRLAMRIFLNILVLKEPSVDRVGGADQKTNREAAPEHETTVRILQLHAPLVVAAIAIGVNEQIEAHKSEPQQADEHEHNAADSMPHSAASSRGGRLWPRRRSTSSAASARLVPGPKIACTPAARSIA